MLFADWAAKWNVPAVALEELRDIYTPAFFDGGSSEAATQARLRVDAPKVGGMLLRNNSGAVETQPDRWVRYGLGNDSKKLNDVWKSSDLIGITQITVQPQHVGVTFGLFTAVEVKHPGWKRPENDRDRAQETFLVTVCQLGGLGMFVSHESQYHGHVARIRNFPGQ